MRKLNSKHLSSVKSQWNAELREKYLEAHPVVIQSYCMHTPMLTRSYAIVRERVAARRTGLVFSGASRLGKTTCAIEMKELLCQEFPKIFIIQISATRCLRPSDIHMYKLILGGQGHNLSVRSDPNQLLGNITRDVVMKVKMRKGSQFVLIIDEIHLLDENDFIHLLAVHNALNLERIKMSTISFAQPEITTRINALKTKAQQQLIARFLCEIICFEGCTSLTELLSLLKLYDDASEFPEGTGLSFTQFFFPQAYANKFLLATYAKEIWSELASVFSDVEENGVPMEHVCATIEHLLLAHRHFDAPNFVFSSDDIKEAVEASNAENFVSYVRSGLKD